MTQTIDILEKLVAFDTVSARSNMALVDYLDAFLEERGFAVTRLSDPENAKAGLFATLGPAGNGLALSAHSDVVPVEGQDWSHDPFRLCRKDGRLYGRGTTDMKGFLAAMLACADRAAGRELREPLKLVVSYDEEIGCVGITQMIDRLAPLLGTPRLCLVGEPTQMQVAVGHKGKQAIRAVCRGEAGHSALAPRFTNALHLAADFVQGLRQLQAELAQTGARDADYSIPYSTVHVGKLAGGTALNIVPDRAELLFEFRHLTQDAPEALRARIDVLAADVGGGRIELETQSGYPGLETDDADAIGLAQHLAQSNGTTKVAFGTEAGFFDTLGIPAIVCGPGSMEGQGHKADEYIEASQLAACDRMLDRLLDHLS